YLDPRHAAASRVPARFAAARGDAGAGPDDHAVAALGVGNTHSRTLTLTRPRKRRAALGLLFRSSPGCGGEIRTRDLRAMSPTSFHCSTPRPSSRTRETGIRLL